MIIHSLSYRVRNVIFGQRNHTESKKDFTGCYLSRRPVREKQGEERTSQRVRVTHCGQLPREKIAKEMCKT